jgi:hypothetical protein
MLGRVVTFTESTADFSPCREFRYRLTRRWSDGPTIAFIGLNPSTADEFQLDPTVTRCVRRADRLGFGRLVMLNLFAFRATDPQDMFKRHRAGRDVIGPDNDEWLRREASEAATVVCAWGNHGTLAGRDREVLRLLGGIKLHCLGKSKTGQPKHPLYLPYSRELVTLGRPL